LDSFGVQPVYMGIAALMLTGAIFIATAKRLKELRAIQD
jgi:hypothetical protein